MVADLRLDVLSGIVESGGRVSGGLVDFSIGRGLAFLKNYGNYKKADLRRGFFRKKRSLEARTQRWATELQQQSVVRSVTRGR